MFKFIFQWAIDYGLIMVAMCTDNICWIPDSPEWKVIKKNFYIMTIFNREFGFPKNKDGWKYVWKNRILEVLKHSRDILPAIITSLLLTIFWRTI